MVSPWHGAWACKDHSEEGKGISVPGQIAALAFLFSGQPGDHPHGVSLLDFLKIFLEAIR